jgi:hypothetical protein
LPGIFQEFDVTDHMKKDVTTTDQDSATANGTNKTVETKLAPPDYVILGVLLLCFWIYYMNFVILETLGSPMVMDEYAWSESETVLYLGLIMTGGGAISMVSFLTVGVLSKRCLMKRNLVICFMHHVIKGSMKENLSSLWELYP